MMDGHDCSCYNSDDTEKKSHPETNEVHDNAFPDFSNYFATAQVFDSRDEIVQWCQQIGRENGFVVVIVRSDRDRVGNPRRATLGCEMSGKVRVYKRKGEKNGRNTASKKIDCPFRLMAKLLKGDGCGWMITVVNGRHNHACADTLQGHSYAGRLDEEQKKLVHEMTDSMVSPTSIWLTLKKRDPDTCTSLRHIYNERAKYERKKKFPFTNMQQLLKLVEEAKYVNFHRRYEDSEIVQDIFWAHPDSISLIQSFNLVLFMDSTYKTNKYRTPLLEMVGQTSTMKTFSVAFAYLQSETSEHFIWALEKLRSLFRRDDLLPKVIVTDKDAALGISVRQVFPDSYHMLCQFHINKNVVSKCRKIIKNKEREKMLLKEWDNVIHCQSIDDYKDFVNHFKSKCEKDEFGAKFFKYVESNWLNESNKVKFVDAWTNKLMHLGNTTTNRVEGAHARLKRLLKHSLGDYTKCFSSMNQMIELQHAEIVKSFEVSRMTVEHRTNVPFFKQLRSIVSRSAMEIIYEEYASLENVGDEPKFCSCLIKTTHGLPCSCELRKYRDLGENIPLNAVHVFWQKLSISSNEESGDRIGAIALLEAAFVDIRKRTEHLDATGILCIAKKLSEISYPQTTSMCPPPDKVATKGAPTKKNRAKMKFERSTKREPSEWEHEDSSCPFPSAKSSKNKGSQTRNKRMAQNPLKQDQKKPCSKKYLLEFHPDFRQYIEDTVNVLSDGNCGYRALALSIYGNENEWMKVRNELLEFLQQHSSFFSYMYANFYEGWSKCGDLYAIALNSLNVSSSSSFVPKDKWLDLPFLGSLIATKYQIILVTVGMYLRSMYTYLPLWGSPIGTHTIVALGFISSCEHWILVNLVKDSPLPIVYPEWIQFRQQGTNDWENPFFDRFARFKLLLSSLDSSYVDLNDD